MKIVNDFIYNLKKWNIVLCPTDTIWWIWWDATNENVINRINALKKRDVNAKQWLVTLFHPEFICEYINCEIDDLIHKYSLCNWPTTFEFMNPKNLPNNINNSNLIAARIPFWCSYLMNVLQRFWKPIISTSANISWSPSPSCFLNVSEIIKNWVDFIIPEQFDVWSGKASTIVSYSDNTIFR